MKVNLVHKPHGWMLMRIETNLVCIQICISNSSPPFKEMYTWLRRIRDRQLPVSMMIDEEGSSAYLIAKESEKEKIEFSIEAWKYNSPYDTYLKTIIDPQQVFQLNDWIRAIIVYLDPEKNRVGLSTKDLELRPEEIFTEPWTVYQNAEMMAEKYKKTIFR